MDSFLRRRTRKIAGALVAAVVAAWIVLALAIAAGLGFTRGAVFAGLKSGPSMVAEFLTPEDSSFRALPPTPAIAVLRENAGRGLSAADGRRLYDLIAGRGYRRALDVGTGSGCAALWLAMGMRATGGKVLTIEIDPATANQARERFRAAEMEDVIETRINDALREVRAIEGNFDLVFLDLGGVHQDKLFELLYPRLAPGGAVVSHNAFGLGYSAAAYLPAVYRKDDMKTTIVPTLSGGLAVSVKTAITAH